MRETVDKGDDGLGRAGRSLVRVKGLGEEIKEGVNKG